MRIHKKHVALIAMLAVFGSFLLIQMWDEFAEKAYIAEAKSVLEQIRIAQETYNSTYGTYITEPEKLIDGSIIRKSTFAIYADTEQVPKYLLSQIPKEYVPQLHSTSYRILLVAQKNRHSPVVVLGVRERDVVTTVLHLNRDGIPVDKQPSGQD